MNKINKMKINLITKSIKGEKVSPVLPEETKNYLIKANQ